MSDSVETKWMQDYETIRRREQTLISNLLEVLPKIDQLGEERVTQVRDAMFHADHPFLMVFVGPFSAGKSSLINVLLGAQDLLRVGPTPTTDRISILRWGDEPQDMQSAGRVDTVFYPSPLLRKVSLVDTPGLESVFRQHEDTTRRFLHRSDVVILVMLATQAMTQSNIKYLQMLREYGKKILLVLNQIDLIAESDLQTLRQYVEEQCRAHLGSVPPIWFVSAKQGKEARSGGFNEVLWKSSGMAQFEEYIEKQLGDVDRLRQKLQTPLKIVQNVHEVALDAVKSNVATFDQYRNITDNINQQLSSQRRAQEQSVREITAEIEAHFKQTTERSGEALRDVFQLSRALGSFGRGVMELIGLARFLRRDTPSHIVEAFQWYKVFEPIDSLPEVVDKLAPRLEGQDMQDIDDLVKYGQREIYQLPADMQDKLIGSIQAPAVYDRSELLNVRSELSFIEDEARTIETEKVEQARRNTLMVFAVWELVMLVLLFALMSAWTAIDNTTDLPIPIITLVILLAGVVGGFAALPLRGRTLHTRFANQLYKLQNRYVSTLRAAADRQMDYGMRLRRDAVGPLVRLVEAQSHIQDAQLQQLQEAEREIGKLESDLNAFGKRRLLGITL